MYPHHGCRICSGCTCGSGWKVQCRGCWLHHMTDPSAGFLSRRWPCTRSTLTRGTIHPHCIWLKQVKAQRQYFVALLHKKDKNKQNYKKSTGKNCIGCNLYVGLFITSHDLIWKTHSSSCKCLILRLINTWFTHKGKNRQLQFSSIKI